MHNSVLHIFRAFALASLCLPLVSACSAVTDGEDGQREQTIESREPHTFINLTVAVSGGKQHTTRAGEKPTAGENGDGREAGFEHENAVTGITLILYQDAVGINTTTDPSTINLDYVKYFTVTRTGTTETPGSQYGDTKKDEAYYTTGNQLVQKGELDLAKQYHAIVVANVDLRFKVSTLKDVLNYKMTTLYSGDEKTAAAGCVNFVMSSEADHVINFPGTTPTVIAEGALYSFDGIRIERMAARIDFWAAGATYNATAQGYEYSVGATDKFVVTGIMPFNLMGASGTNGGEYLIKRVATSPTATAYNYLGDEGSNFVIDPAILAKTTSGGLTYYKNRVEDFNTTYSVTSLANIATYSGVNDYYRSIKDLHGAIVASPASGGYATLTDGALTGEDVVVCYPMENTLQTSSYLFNFATGIVIEGDYYQGGLSGTKTHRIYYGYLRHEGTATSYQARLGAAFELDASTALPPASPMEYGIVRNNIYRIYISSITPESMIMTLKVKKWDPFIHDWIYM